MPDSAVKSQQLDASELRAVESLDARRTVTLREEELGRRVWIALCYYMDVSLNRGTPKSSILIGFL